MTRDRLVRARTAWERVRALESEIPALDARYAQGLATVRDIRRQEDRIAAAIRAAVRAEDVGDARRDD